MASKALRRLANDHANLHKHGLPPNYLFPPTSSDSYSDLTALSLLLAGPENTPYATGIFHLDLRMEPGGYPTKPPTATFRTKIFHPNVDPSTGAVCVDTLKRDWKPELTLRDVLVTISCLLVCPNPASALNAEAGKLMEEDFSFFERRAAMWAKMYAAIPVTLKDAVDEAKMRVIGEPQQSIAQSKSKGKKRLEAPDSEQTTQGIENTPNIVGTRPIGELQTPIQSTTLQITPAHAQRPIGLGLDQMDTSPDTSILIDNTPSLAPRRPTRKRYAMLPPQPRPTSPLHATSTQDHQATTPSTASTPHFPTTSYLTTPTTPQNPFLSEPPAKRRRTNSQSPPAAFSQPSRSVHMGLAASLPRFQNPLLPSIVRSPYEDPFHTAFVMPWLEWDRYLPRTAGLSKGKGVRVVGMRRGIFRL